MAILKETTIPRRDRKLCPTIDTGKGLTEQAHKDQCDINQILRDYARTGFMKHAKENEGRYDDVSAVDFQKAQITVANVKSMFEGLPSQIRKEFDHDPSRFLNYVQDPSNALQLQQRGIIVGNDGIDITGAYTAAPTKAPEPAEVSSAGDGAKTSDSASDAS